LPTSEAWRDISRQPPKAQAKRTPTATIALALIGPDAGPAGGLVFRQASRLCEARATQMDFFASRDSRSVTTRPSDPGKRSVAAFA
jgi:hypothetical protein